jgi:hypothetical protein
MDFDYLPLVIMLFVLLQYMDSDYLPLVIMLFVLIQYMDSDDLPWRTNNIMTKGR